MQVSRLEVFGFKSFMDRLVLSVEPGVTAIVGPNGCGKSNVVDSLRWVLGETKASSLRGGTLEDVIFNGTDKLRPLGLAEVSITVRSSDDNFFADLVSPSAEADLVVEGIEEEIEETTEEEVEPVESPEATESDQAERIAENLDEEGKPKLTVIEGGEASEEETETPQEVSVEQSETPAVEAPTLLTRFSWLKSVSEVQVTRRLYRSGESEFFINRVPCRLKDLKEFFRAIGLGARAYTIVAQGEVSRIVTSKPEERRLMIEDAAGVLGFRDKIAAANRRLKETEQNIARLEDIEKEVSRQVASLKRQANKAQNRQRLKDEIAEMEQALFRGQFLEHSEELKKLQGEADGITAREKQAESKMSSLKAEEEHARNMLMTVDVEGDELRSKIDSIKEELNERSRQRTEKQARIGELKAFALSKETEIKRLYERRSTLETRQRESADARSELEGKEQELSAKLNQIDTSGEEELRELSARIENLKSALKDKDRLVRVNREKLISARSSLGAIHDQLIAASPVSQLKATLGEGGASSFADVTSAARTFVDGLNIKEEYAAALQAVAAERAQFLVAENPFEIARSFQELVRSAGENAKGLGLGVLRAGTAQETTSVGDNLPFVPITNYIQHEPDFASAVQAVFGSVFCCESLDQAIAYFEGNESSDITLVTREGDILTRNSFYSLRHEGGLLQLKVRSETLETECAELEVQEEKLVNEQRQAAEALQNAEDAHKELLEKTRERQKQAREIGNELGSVKGRLGAERRVFEQLVQDLERVDQQITEAKGRVEGYAKEQEEVQEMIQALVPENEAQLHENLRKLNEEYMTLDESRREGRMTLGQAAEKVDEARNELDSARAQASQISLHIQKIEIELDHLKERVYEEYGEHIYRQVSNVYSEEGRLEDETKTDYSTQVARLKTRIAREGEVDPTSIERYEEESTRLEDLKEQLADLDSAKNTLKKTITRLREISEERFLKTFEAVRRNFSELVPRLFGGGKGDLTLEDPTNPLDCGVDIIARPPGKKLKSIELLSGGEKALCATALIFAMFKERPSPLCVLDEVDAPLDDANLVRFLTLIKEMSAKTQFLMITHNKASMQVADRLIGVTMQEPGASNVLSVSLQEAVTHAA